jgi:hypothetical protein
MSTHQSRAAQNASESAKASGQPGESEEVRYGEAKDPTPLTKAQRKRLKDQKPGMFDTRKYKCWMTGNGHSKL